MGLDQNRTDNTVNEITDITETAGPSWVTPAYNRAGNMTTIPKPADPDAVATPPPTTPGTGSSEIEEGANNVAEYEYDGSQTPDHSRRLTLPVLLSETRHFLLHRTVKVAGY